MSSTIEAITTTVAFGVPDELAAAEAVDVTLIGDTLESVDVGPFAGVYYRVSAANLVHAVAVCRALLDEIESAVFDARQERLDAERHVCPGCPTLLEPDENTCGSARCEREWAMDCAGLVP